jgi:hypothetical protein
MGDINNTFMKEIKRMWVKKIHKQYLHSRDKEMRVEEIHKQYLHIRDKKNEGERET